MTGPQKTSDPDHPVWGVIRLLIVVAGTAAIMAMFCSKFDGDEVRDVSVVTGIVGALEWWRHQQVTAKKNGKP